MAVAMSKGVSGADAGEKQILNPSSSPRPGLEKVSFYMMVRIHDLSEGAFKCRGAMLEYGEVSNWRSELGRRGFGGVANNGAGAAMLV